VRSGAGHLVLTDQGGAGQGGDADDPGHQRGAFSWLTRKGLRTFCSLNVRSAECIDPHYFAVLIGCGATVVNAYLAEDSLADRIDAACSTGR
jgi:glutamate synthase (NADPH/NADH) large chain